MNRDASVHGRRQVERGYSRSRRVGAPMHERDIAELQPEYRFASQDEVVEVGSDVGSDESETMGYDGTEAFAGALQAYAQHPSGARGARSDARAAAQWEEQRGMLNDRLSLLTRQQERPAADVNAVNRSRTRDMELGDASSSRHGGRSERLGRSGGRRHRSKYTALGTSLGEEIAMVANDLSKWATDYLTDHSVEGVGEPGFSSKGDAGWTKLVRDLQEKRGVIATSIQEILADFEEAESITFLDPASSLSYSEVAAFARGMSSKICDTWTPNEREILEGKYLKKLLLRPRGSVAPMSQFTNLAQGMATMILGHTLSERGEGLLAGAFVRSIITDAVSQSGFSDIKSYFANVGDDNDTLVRQARKLYKSMRNIPGVSDTLNMSLYVNLHDDQGRNYVHDLSATGGIYKKKDILNNFESCFFRFEPKSMAGLESHAHKNIFFYEPPSLAPYIHSSATSAKGDFGTAATNIAKLVKRLEKGTDRDAYSRTRSLPEAETKLVAARSKKYDDANLSAAVSFDISTPTTVKTLAKYIQYGPKAYGDKHKTKWGSIKKAFTRSKNKQMLPLTKSRVRLTDYSKTAHIASDLQKLKSFPQVPWTQRKSKVELSGIDVRRLVTDFVGEKRSRIRGSETFDGKASTVAKLWSEGLKHGPRNNSSELGFTP